MTAQPQRDRTSQLHLVSAPQRSHSLLALWHLLSLDAPTVATVWTLFIAHAAHMRLPWTAPVSMFVAVWMLYAADRLLDARMSSREELELRHHFHHRHRIAFLAAVLAASLALAWLVPMLPASALRLYALLSVLLAVYFFLIHVAPAGAKRLPKELAVGLFFPAAVFIPTVARDPSLRLSLLPNALLLAAVCTLNCLYLYSWEHRPPYAQAHWTTRFAVTRLQVLTVSAAVASLFLCVAQHSSVALATGISSLLLMMLHLLRQRISTTHLRAAADVALLTPMLIPALWR